MYKKFRFIILINILFINILFATDIKFTIQEQEYLKNKKEIKMCVDPNWMPFEKIENGKHIGLASDYIKIAEKSIHIPINLVQTSSWDDSIVKTKNRECDIYSLVSKTPNREKYMDFSIPYLETPIVIATKKIDIFIDNINSIKHKKLGIVKGYSIIELYKKKYPDINIVEVASINDGLNRVEKGELFGYIDNSIVITKQIQKNHIGLLQISGKFDTKLKFSVATRNDEKHLVAIFNKVIQNIDEKTKINILNSWVGINQNNKKQLQLTQDEKEYLKQHIFTINMTTGWIPFNYKNKNGKPAGMGIDYWNLISNKVGIKSEYIISSSFTDVLENIKNKRYDLIIATTQTSNNLQYSIFSQAYESFPIAIATLDNDYITINSSILKNKKVAVVKNFSAYYLLKSKYPNIDFIITKNTKEALKLVKDKKVFACIDIEPSLYYQIHSNDFQDIKISTLTDMNFNLQIMLRDDLQKLQTIINKAISMITKDEKINIYKKWMKIQQSTIDYTLVWQIFILLMVVSIVAILFIVILRKKS